jgi:hypothetical protein
MGMSPEFYKEEDYILVARVLYVANLMDQPNDSNDSKFVAEFVRSGTVPDCVVFQVVRSLSAATTMVQYFRSVWLDKDDFVWNLDEARVRVLTDALRRR